MIGLKILIGKSTKTGMSNQNMFQLSMVPLSNSTNLVTRIFGGLLEMSRRFRKVQQPNQQLFAKVLFIYEGIEGWCTTSNMSEMNPHYSKFIWYVSIHRRSLHQKLAGCQLDVHLLHLDPLNGHVFLVSWSCLVATYWDPDKMIQDVQIGIFTIMKIDVNRFPILDDLTGWENIAWILHANRIPLWIGKI